MLSIPSSVMITTSPGSISLTKSAPIISKAQVSEHKIYEPSKLPKTSGLAEVMIHPSSVTIKADKKIIG